MAKVAPDEGVSPIDTAHVQPTQTTVQTLHTEEKVDFSKRPVPPLESVTPSHDQRGSSAWKTRATALLKISQTQMNKNSPRKEYTNEFMLTRSLNINVDIWVHSFAIEAKDGLERMLIKFSVMFEWHDHRLCALTEIPDNLWKPELFAFGEEVNFTSESVEKAPAFRDKLKNHGWVTYTCTTEEVVIPLLQDYYGLKMFPFDSMRFDFVVCPSGDVRLETMHEISTTFKGLKWNAPTLSGEFKAKSASFSTGKHTSSSTKLSYPDIMFSIHIARNPVFYIFKTIVPLECAVGFGLMSYFQDIYDMTGRLATIIGMFLTCFALQWLTLDRLPRVSYLTILDRVIGLAVALLFFSAFGSCIVSRWVYGRMDPEDPLDVQREQRLNKENADQTIALVLTTLYLLAHLYLMFRIWRARRTGGMYRTFAEGKSFANTFVKPVGQAREIALSEDRKHSAPTNITDF